VEAEEQVQPVPHDRQAGHDQRRQAGKRAAQPDRPGLVDLEVPGEGVERRAPRRIIRIVQDQFLLLILQILRGAGL
jgi:hypothetical protein